MPATCASKARAIEIANCAVRSLSAPTVSFTTKSLIMALPRRYRRGSEFTRVEPAFYMGCPRARAKAAALSAAPSGEGLGEAALARSAFFDRDDGALPVAIHDRDVEPRTLLEELNVALH